MKVLLLIVSLTCSLYTSAQTSKIQSYFDESNPQNIKTVNHFVIDNGKLNNTLRFTYFDKFINHLVNSSSNMNFSIYEITDASINKLEVAYSEAGLTEIHNIARSDSFKEEIIQEDSTVVFQETKDYDERRMTINCESFTSDGFKNSIINLSYGDNYKLVIFPGDYIDTKLIESLEANF